MTLTCHLGLPGSSHCPSAKWELLVGGWENGYRCMHVWPSPFSAHLKLSQRVNWLHPNTKRSFPSPFTRNRLVSWLHSNTHAQNAAGAARFHQWARLIWHAALSGHPASMCVFLREGWEGASVTGPWTCNVHEGVTQAGVLLTTTPFTDECGTIFQDYSHSRGHLFLLVCLGSCHGALT